jgi:transcriptional regulator with XRE-family HTH domain
LSLEKITQNRGDLPVVIKLTKGERLVIWRRRLRYKQKEAAAYFAVTVDTYADWEKGRREDVPVIRLEPRPFELCYVLRRRARMTQKALAAQLGMTRLWVIKMEEGSAPVERLRAYWRF